MSTQFGRGRPVGTVPYRVRVWVLLSFRIIEGCYAPRAHLPRLVIEPEQSTGSCILDSKADNTLMSPVRHRQDYCTATCTGSEAL